MDQSQNTTMDLRTDWTGKSEDLCKVRRVRATIPDISTIGDEHIRECHHLCRVLWLSVICDAKDTWQYYPEHAVTEAQQVWEERIVLFETEMEKRKLEPLY